MSVSSFRHSYWFRTLRAQIDAGISAAINARTRTDAEVRARERENLGRIHAFVLALRATIAFAPEDEAELDERIDRLARALA